MHHATRPCPLPPCGATNYRPSAAKLVPGGKPSACAWKQAQLEQAWQPKQQSTAASLTCRRGQDGRIIGCLVTQRLQSLQRCNLGDPIGQRAANRASASNASSSKYRLMHQLGAAPVYTAEHPPPWA